MGRYIPGQSWLHRLDPRTKVLCGLIFVFLVLHITSPFFLAGVVLSLFLLPLITTLPLYITAQVQKSLLFLLTVVVLLNGALTPGHSVELIGHTLPAFTIEGLTRGGTLALRLNSVVLLFAWVTITTSPTEMSDSLELLLKPLNKLNVPTRDIVLAFVVALRFVPIVFREAERLLQAQWSRGAQFSGIRRLTRFIPILLPLFVAAFTKAERLTQALESRGYQHTKARSQYQTLSFKQCDWLAFITVGCFAISMFIIL
ncbi:MAG: energy-coupling factor transporter transmembrane protein EcfT [Candidatus Latescibacteria bacterium]|nr:energy-coupling factor transporter transmembrane protein EcfT [Candidatus Latescibacterota bacterium]MBT5832493.1 energy-coupling factor transporter transmembrane protein EcfT [Candidatus Latescibacterota bacterium]